MAEPTAASPPGPPPSSLPSDAAAAGGGGGANKSSTTSAAPDDFLSLAAQSSSAPSSSSGGGGGTNRGDRSGDSPPPPERKQLLSGAPAPAAAPPHPLSSSAPGSGSMMVKSGGGGSRRAAVERYGLGGGSSGGGGNSSMKFQFYVPTTSGDASSDNINNNAITNNNTTWGNNRTGTTDLERNTNSKTSSKQKGIDPPEKELPTSATAIIGNTSMSAEESARNARSRLIQLQHRGSAHREVKQESSVASAAPPRISSGLAMLGLTGAPPPPSQQLPPERSLSDSSRSTKSAKSKSKSRRNRVAAGMSNSLGALESMMDELDNDKGNDDDDIEDEDDFPLVTMDPVESDDEPVSDHFEEGSPPMTLSKKKGQQQQQSQQQQKGQSGQQPRYRSPPRVGEHPSYMKKHPSSAPQRPSHRLPPQQLMQYLHAGGRGNFGRQGGGGMQGGGMFPLPLNNNSGPNSNSGGPGNNNNNNNNLSSNAPHRPQYNMAMQHPQQQQQQQQQPLHRNMQLRRKSSEQTRDLYSEGIDLLEKTASEAREREEVDTLNDGINYLRNLETSLEALEGKGDVGGQQPHTLSHPQQRRSSGSGAPPSGGIMSSPRKQISVPTATGPPPSKAPPPPPPFKGQQAAMGNSGGATTRPHRPPPSKQSNKDGSETKSRSRSNSLGDEMQKLVLEMQQQEQQQKQHRQAGGGQGGVVGAANNNNRVHRPPPPRKASYSNPGTPTQVRKRPVITAKAAMDYVMNASARPPFDGSNGVDAGAGGAGSGGGGMHPPSSKDSEKVESDIHKMQSFLNAMMREEGEEAIAVSGGQGVRPYDDIDDDDDDDSESSDDSTLEKDDFERNTSLSMHAEAKSKLGGGGGGTSRYAEDKHGMSGTRLDCKKRGEHKGSHRSMDPPDAEDDSDEEEEDNLELVNDHSSEEEGISPSVLPMRTMNERLYAVETVIPTPTRYEEEGFAEDSVNSFDQALPRLHPPHGGGGGEDMLPSHTLGPRSQRPGGITGVVLDDEKNSSHQHHHSRLKLIERERLRNKELLTSESSSVEDSSGISESSSDGSSSSSSSNDNHPQSTLDPLGSAGEMEKYSSWSGELIGDGSSGSRLMMKLCSHLLPAGLGNTFDHHNRMLSQNKSNLEWDDDDPDEPGYIVHRLTNSQLVGIENAFEKMVASLERSSEDRVRNGTNDENFERDLEEAERMLDQEEKRYKDSENKGKKLDPEATTSRSAGMELLLQQTKQRSQESSEVRESVPDFPGIYPPGKGKAGEMECFYLPIITKSQKTGFEPTKDLVLKPGSVFANNYLVQSELGSAAFSTAYRCLDLSSEEDEDGYQDEVCLKVIKNTKDYFDQSLDEIKILQLLKDTNRVQENNIVEMKSFFYHREHLVIVTELLRQNLYEFGKSILESRGPLYFTRLRLSHITRQCLVALKFVHELGLMHCDIKPENILLSSYSRALVKVIDFGSSSFVTDRQSSYIQSRSYRAPEVILGLPYDGKIDMWSLGCVVAEMYTNEVTFQNDSELSMLSRIEAICGPFPRHMIAKGRNSHRIFTDSGLIYEKASSADAEDDDHDGRSHQSSDNDEDKAVFNVYQPKMTTVAARLGFDEDFMDQPKLSEDDKKRALFVDFVTKLLTTDPDGRPSAAEALNHPWITSSLDLSEEEIRYGQ